MVRTLACQVRNKGSSPFMLVKIKKKMENYTFNF